MRDGISVKKLEAGENTALLRSNVESSVLSDKKLVIAALINARSTSPRYVGQLLIKSGVFATTIFLSVLCMKLLSDTNTEFSTLLSLNTTKACFPSFTIYQPDLSDWIYDSCGGIGKNSQVLSSKCPNATTQYQVCSDLVDNLNLSNVSIGLSVMMLIVTVVVLIVWILSFFDPAPHHIPYIESLSSEMITKMHTTFPGLLAQIDNEFRASEVVNAIYMLEPELRPEGCFTKIFRGVSAVGIFQSRENRIAGVENPGADVDPEEFYGSDGAKP